jgi:rhodanese-related sulfurtransferase
LALAQTPDKQAPAATSAEKTPAATIETKPAVAEVPKTPAPLAPIITSKEAYEMWQKDPEKIKILDCRSPEEFAVVGHAPMAYNIPNMFMTYRWNPKKNDYLWKENPRFIKEVKKTFKPTDTIVVMCRSGNRSPKAVEKMVKAGYKNLYEIREGFEGGKVKDKNDPNYGKRAKNGWRLAGLPWTYALDTNLIYLPEGKPKEK